MLPVSGQYSRTFAATAAGRAADAVAVGEGAAAIVGCGDGGRGEGIAVVTPTQPDNVKVNPAQTASENATLRMLGNTTGNDAVLTGASVAAIGVGSVSWRPVVHLGGRGVTIIWPFCAQGALAGSSRGRVVAVLWSPSGHSKPSSWALSARGGVSLLCGHEATTLWTQNGQR